MDREKQIEEIANVIYDDPNSYDTYWRSNCEQLAETIYNAGYHKQSKGEWEKFEGERFICSNCAKVFGLGSTATIYDVKRVWKYCPNCGAKMKGGEE